MADYRDVNRANWDERVSAHVASPDYAVDQFYTDPGFLSGVVRYDVPLLGSIAGLRGAHLQCHIGTDTVSLARLGASMTGLDFSRPAIVARRQADGHRPRRARQRAVERAARADDRERRRVAADRQPGQAALQLHAPGCQVVRAIWGLVWASSGHRPGR